MATKQPMTVQRLRQLEADARTYAKMAGKAVAEVEKAYRELGGTPELKMVEAVRLEPMPDRQRWFGDAEKACSDYFRWVLKDTGEDRQQLTIECPTFLRGRLGFVVRGKVVGGGY